MSRKIVVGVATVDEPDPALATAIRLAESTGAVLHAVHVVDPPIPIPIAYRMGGGALAIDPAVEQAHREAIRAAVEAQSARIATRRHGFHAHVLTGSAHAELTAFATEIGAELIVIGATRAGKAWQNVVGTTAERILRESTVPVLVLHRPFFRSVERILLTTDLSELSAAVHDRALDVAERLFDPRELEVRSLLVLGYHLPPPPPLPAEAVEEAGSLEMQRFLSARKPRGFGVSGRVRVGEAPMEINVEADAWGADLIVLGTRGRSGLPRYVFGSVAAATLRDATRNVLVIPPPAEPPSAVTLTAAADGVV